MTPKRRKLRAVLATVPLELGQASHRLRHHGKHHHGDLWRAFTVSGDVINATATPQVDRSTICYTTNEVLLIIGLTCVLNLAFIVVIMSCVHFCSSPTTTDLPRLESLILIGNSTLDTDLESTENKNNLSQFNLTPVCKTRMMEDHIRNHTLPLQASISSSRLSSMSIQTMVPTHSTLPSDLRQPSHRPEATGFSFSMENLLFV